MIPCRDTMRVQEKGQSKKNNLNLHILLTKPLRKEL